MALVDDFTIVKAALVLTLLALGPVPACLVSGPVPSCSLSIEHDREEEEPQQPQLEFGASPSSIGWVISVVPSDPAIRDIRVRVGEQTAFETVEQNFFTMPITAGPTRIEAMVRREGRDFGPITYDFDPTVETVRFHRRTLNQVRYAWISWNKHENGTTVFFSPLQSGACALAKVEYGYNVEVPDRELPLRKCGGPNEGLGTDVMLSEVVSHDIDFVVVRVTWSDGTRDEILRFDHPGVG